MTMRYTNRRLPLPLHSRLISGAFYERVINEHFLCEFSQKFCRICLCWHVPRESQFTLTNDYDIGSTNTNTNTKWEFVERGLQIVQGR